MNRTARNVLAGSLAWAVGAGTAVGVGLVALSIVDTGLVTDGRSVPVSDADPAGEPGTAPVTPAPGASRTPGPAVPQRRVLGSAGGSVIASCAGAVAYLISWSPAQGYRVTEVHRGPASEVEIKFAGAAGEIQLSIRCHAGVPVAEHGEPEASTEPSGRAPAG